MHAFKKEHQHMHNSSNQCKPDKKRATQQQAAKKSNVKSSVDAKSDNLISLDSTPKPPTPLLTPQLAALTPVHVQLQQAVQVQAAQTV